MFSWCPAFSEIPAHSKRDEAIESGAFIVWPDSASSDYLLGCGIVGDRAIRVHMVIFFTAAIDMVQFSLFSA